MRKLRRWMTAFGAVMVLAIACGKVDGGGDSETNWLKPCNADHDCKGYGTCLCGVCSKRCDDAQDCALLGVPSGCTAPSETSSCASTVEANICTPRCDDATECPRGFECQASSCIPVQPTGAAGAPSFGGGGSGGGSCIPDPGLGNAGAFSARPIVPPPGSTCRAEQDGLEICTNLGTGTSTSLTVLSRCTNERWETIEEPSSCTTAFQECNVPGANDGVCCDVPRYCGALQVRGAHGYCDGKTWTMVPAAAGTGGTGAVSAAGGTGGAGAANCTPDANPAGGAFAMPAVPPPEDAPCNAEDEGLELCTYRSGNGGQAVLSRCTNRRWETVADPSSCTAIYRECNRPGARTGVCCDEPRYCAALPVTGVPGYCNGSSWSLQQTAGGSTNAGTGGAGGAGGASCIPPDPNAPIGGAFAVPATPPADGAPCPPERQDFELCTTTINSGNVLSVCTSAGWSTQEAPSDCPTSFQNCNEPKADGVCCTPARACDGWFCDGERWWAPQ